MKIGDRVRYSQEWLKTLTARRHEIAIARRGIVIKIQKYIYVLWDGAKKPANYAAQFIEIDK